MNSVHRSVQFKHRLTAVLVVILALAALIFSVAVAAKDELQPIPPVGRVVDQTNTLTPAEVATMATKLEALETRSGAQVAVLLVPSTQPEEIEPYALRVQEAWQLGRRGIDDGILLVVATEDRAVRIEVGYGLEGAVPDARANRIIDTVLIPAFKAGKIQLGLDGAIDQLSALIEYEPLPVPAKVATDGGLGVGWILLLVFGGLAFLVLIIWLLGRGASLEAPGTAKGLPPREPWQDLGSYSPPPRPSTPSAPSRTSRSSSSSSFGSRSSGSSWGSSSSRSSFKGGGGRSGGGGASGKW